jgi:hypothetical protein
VRNRFNQGIDPQGGQITSEKFFKTTPRCAVPSAVIKVRFLETLPEKEEGGFLPPPPSDLKQLSLVSHGSIGFT